MSSRSPSARVEARQRQQAEPGSPADAGPNSTPPIPEEAILNALLADPPEEAEPCDPFILRCLLGLLPPDRADDVRAHLRRVIACGIRATEARRWVALCDEEDLIQDGFREAVRRVRGGRWVGLGMAGCMGRHAAVNAHRRVVGNGRKREDGTRRERPACVPLAFEPPARGDVLDEVLRREPAARLARARDSAVLTPLDVALLDLHLSGWPREEARRVLGGMTLGAYAHAWRAMNGRLPAALRATGAGAG